MTALTEILLALLLVTDLSLAVASRLLHSIKIVALQGWIIGLFPLAAWCWRDGMPRVSFYLIVAVTLLVKAILLPAMLRRAMYKAEVKRELEPLVGYSLSCVIVLAAMGMAFWFCRYHIALPNEVPALCLPAALSTIFTGLFIIIARRKAITQVIGFLIFENGITAFGLGMMLEYGILVELGILLDVFVLVFIMGIALFHINREFAHIDADQLHFLRDDEKERGAK